MAGPAKRFPDAIFLRRPDGTGYGFFFKSEADFTRAVDSFRKPILRSFKGEPIPNQPDPDDHLITAIATLLGQAFDRTVAKGAGSEAVSWAAAACARTTFPAAMPQAIVIERRDGKLAVRPGPEFLKQPGFPLAVVLDGGPHGGEAQFFDSDADYRGAAQRELDSRSWLPQILFRLYETTPSVMAGRPLRDPASGTTGVEFRAITFGTTAPLIERATGA